MIELPLTPEGILYGKRMRREFHHAREYFPSDTVDRRWVGHAAEFELDRWLTERGIEHTWNGGLDDLPDFVIGDEQNGIRLALKTNNYGGKDEPTSLFQFAIPEPQTRKLHDGVLLVIAQTQRNRLLIAGYIDADHFRRFAQKHKQGEEGFVDGRPVKFDCRSIPANMLVAAEVFFGCLEVAA